MGFAYRPHYPRPDAATRRLDRRSRRARAGACCHGRQRRSGNSRHRRASTTVITAEEIAHSPAQTVQEIIAQVPGVQLTSLFGGVNGAQDHRRSARIRRVRHLQYPDPHQWPQGERHRYAGRGSLHHSARFDRAHRNHRGNSGAVLYGDNAVGGVINIVTKTGVGGPPVADRASRPASARSTSAWRSIGRDQYGPWSTSFYGNQIKSDGYRVNNALDQRNGVGESQLHHARSHGFLTVSGDDQKLGFPGGRLVDPSIGVNQLVTDRKGAATPFDYGNQQGANATAGFTKSLWNGVDLIVDGGVRDKKQQGGFFGGVPLSPFEPSPMSTQNLQTWSITPR
jgi:iron complex outermembrane receptor protein